MQKRNEFPGRTVLVTGGGGGIGRLMAQGAAERGAHVIVWDLSPEAAEETVRTIRVAGGTADAQTVDVTDRQAVADAARAVPRVDVLINNAGIVTGKSIMDASDEAIERTFSVNTLSLYWVTRAFLPGMRERGHGTVVTLASAAGLVGVAKQTDYSASKFAAFGFAESLRVEMAKEKTGVRSLVVCPYYIDTGMFDGVQTRFPHLLPILQPEYVARKVLDSIASGREMLIMPRAVRTLPILRAAPVRVFDRMMGFAGINSSMDHFAGHSSVR